MPEPANTLLIEGTFEELAEELAQYLDHLRKPPPNEDGSAGGAGTMTVRGEVMRLLGENQKDEVLKRLVTASAALNGAPERGMTFLSISLTN
jgi:translation initiation factor 3 subunit M